jgi:RNA polymerase sigma-70 factor (ECF subfamily)
MLEVSTSVRSYLYAATRNRALNHLRHDQLERETTNRFEVTDQHPEMSHGQDNVVMRLSDEELAVAIGQAIERLPRKTREVVRLRWYHNLSQGEIATALGVSPKTVESQMRNAFHAMREELQRFRG